MIYAHNYGTLDFETITVYNGEGSRCATVENALGGNDGADRTTRRRRW